MLLIDRNVLVTLGGDFFIRQRDRLTLEAEYIVYSGQGKVPRPEDRFRIRPFRLKFNLNSYIQFMFDSIEV